MPAALFASPVCQPPPESHYITSSTHPSRYDSTNVRPQASLQGNSNGGVPSTSPFDPFVTASNPLSAASAVGPVQANPFAHDTAAAAAALGGAFFAGQSGFQQPVGLYAT